MLRIPNNPDCSSESELQLDHQSEQRDILTRLEKAKVIRQLRKPSSRKVESSYHRGFQTSEVIIAEIARPAIADGFSNNTDR